MITKIGLDLGYANIVLSDSSVEIYREPSVALLYKEPRAEGGRIIAVGNDAMNGGDGAPADDGMLIRPFKNGLLYSSDITDEIITHIIKSIGPYEKLRCIIALPSSFNSKQDSEIFDMLTAAGVSECYSVRPAMAALVGAGYSPNISAVSVNVGASSTEIAVLHKGKIILSAREAVGGEDFDVAVKEYVFDQGDVTISLLIARTIKERLGAVWQGRESDSVDIEGILSLTGNKVRMTVSTEDVVGVVEKPLQKLLMAIANTVKKIPTECITDIFENGIILSGGGAELFGLDVMISKVLGIGVTLAKDPIDAACRGLARIHSFIPSKMKINAKDITSSLAKYYEAKYENQEKVD